MNKTKRSTNIPPAKSKSSKRTKMSVPETTFLATRPPIQLSITAASIQGGRDHMEDRFHVNIARDDSGKLDHIFAAVFDGHGGYEASEYARRHMYNKIMGSAVFETDQDILDSIHQGFISTFVSMREASKNWPEPNMPGTTASCALFRQGKIYIGHVGDSAVIKGSDARASEQITAEHKPEDPSERKKVLELGGNVKASKTDCLRVTRKIVNKSGEEVGDVPKLAMTRALGDFWSKSPKTGMHVVQPVPDVSVAELNPLENDFVVLATDGVTNALGPAEIMALLKKYDSHQDENAYPLNHAQLLVKAALTRWKQGKIKADNITAICIKVDPALESAEKPHGFIKEDPQLQINDASNSSAMLLVTEHKTQQLRTNAVLKLGKSQRNIQKEKKKIK